MPRGRGWEQCVRREPVISCRAFRRQRKLYSPSPCFLKYFPRGRAGHAFCYPSSSASVVFQEAVMDTGIAVARPEADPHIVKQWAAEDYAIAVGLLRECPYHGEPYKPGKAY